MYQACTNSAALFEYRQYVQVDKAGSPSQEAALLQAAMSLFSRNVKEPFHLTLFNLGATNFAEAGASGTVSIKQAFKMTQPTTSPKQAAQETIQNPGKYKISRPSRTQQHIILKGQEEVLQGNSASFTVEAVHWHYLGVDSALR